MYPCGEWDLLHWNNCDCAALDRLGNVLKIGERCVILPRKQPTSDLHAADLYLMQKVKDVRVKDFYMTDIIEFRGIQKGFTPETDYCGSVDISDVIAIRAFRKLYFLAIHFTMNTRRKLVAFRNTQPLAEYLHWSELRRVSQVSAAVNRIFFLEARNGTALLKQLCSGGRSNVTKWKFTVGALTPSLSFDSNSDGQFSNAFGGSC